MPEALAKGLASKWYPDIPEAEHWKHYAELVWEDFWSKKDLLQNDTGYFQDTVRAYAFSGGQLLGDDRYLSDADMQKIWHRLMMEITPDGAINPYGPNGGWNSTAALRVGMLEAVASAAQKGTYRFAAHKAMNYLLYQNDATLGDGERVVFARSQRADADVAEGGHRRGHLEAGEAQVAQQPS